MGSLARVLADQTPHPAPSVLTRLRLAVAATALWAVALAPRPALAQSTTTVNTRGAGTSTDWSPLLGYYDYGDQACCSGSARYYTPYTVGQTFTVPVGTTTLRQFSFWLGSYGGAAGAPDGQLRFNAYLMAWGGNAATGSVLWQSGVQNGSTAAVFTGSTTGQEYRFAPGVQLVAGQQYVFFLSAIDQLGTAYPGKFLLNRVEQRNGSTYAGGTMVSLAPSGPRSGVGTTDYYRTHAWTSGASDLGFTAVFVTPEPGSAVLMALGVALGAC